MPWLVKNLDYFVVCTVLNINLLIILKAALQFILLQLETSDSTMRCRGFQKEFEMLSAHWRKIQLLLISCSFLQEM